MVEFSPRYAEPVDDRSFFDFVKVELTRGYVPEHDEERFTARREKIYTFMKIPREVEKFMIYGVLQCIDSFLYIHTFLPIRYVLAVCAVIWRPISTCFGLRRRGQRLLAPAEVCDLLKGSIWIAAIVILNLIDTNRMYHIIKSQSVIKLYIFYNMLEVGDRLLCAFGQDTIDALFWTATEPKERSRNRIGIFGHTIFALFYVTLHSGLIMFQATTLNVAINSDNKGLLGIMMSNNFVELKGSVFKKFDKNNLFQLTCSDVRERVHLTVLLFVVVIQTMKEFNWSSEQFLVLFTDCFFVMLVEFLIDWIKHAFITRFNELPADVYKEFTISLAYDMTQTRQKHAFSDHSDLVARRMGFIPFPLGVVLIKALYSAIPIENAASVLLVVMAFVTLISCRILNTICALGKACDLMEQHQKEKQLANAAGATNPPVSLASAFTSTTHSTTSASNPTTTTTTASSNLNIGGIHPLPNTPAKLRTADNMSTSQIVDASTSPIQFTPLQRSVTVDTVADLKPQKETPANNSKLLTEPNLGATALFSNSDVELDRDVGHNEHLLNESEDAFSDDQLTRSEPDLQQTESNDQIRKQNPQRRTHKRSESEPFIHAENGSH